MTSKRSDLFVGICLHGPYAGVMMAHSRPIYSYTIQQEPPEAVMYKIGHYRHHSIDIGGQSVGFWIEDGRSTIDAITHVLEVYAKAMEQQRAENS